MEGAETVRVIVVGAGIVGLATAARLAARGDEVVVLDKEASVAAHQTGHNSGVIHSGMYYPPGSLKARLAVAGNASMTAFARDHGVAYRTTGKLVVATRPEELPRLTELAERGWANGVRVREIGPEEARAHEPNVRCLGALWVESTGIVDYRGVCEVLAGQVRDAGGRVLFGRRFVGARTDRAEGPGALRSRVRVLVRAVGADREGPGRDLPDRGRQGLRVSDRTGSDGERTDHQGPRPAGRDREQYAADALIVCGGLQGDLLARACGVDPEARIVPFRGEYFELSPRAASLVNGLVYPLPDPRFPFLGVHLTSMLNGSVHAGPNAVFALSREGYRRADLSARDVADALSWPGMWRLAAKNVVPGAFEVARSHSRRLFARSLSRLVPGIGAGDLRPAPAGVRAQALRRDGSLVDDFLVRTAPRQVHVINAPSPAATASLEIAKYIEQQVDEVTAR